MFEPTFVIAAAALVVGYAVLFLAGLQDIDPTLYESNLT